MCADTKLVFAYKLGDRTLPDATAFFKDVAAKLKRSTPKGPFVVKPAVVTDGLKAYEKAYEHAFGDDATFGRIVKHYSNTDKNGEPTLRSRFKGASREEVVGSTPNADIHTNYIERQNLNLRMQNRRYTRKSNGFSKTLKNHQRHLALWIMYHNYCWIPRPQRPTRAERAAGLDRWHKRETAALAVGLTDKLWTAEDLLDATDKFTKARAGTLAEAEPTAPAPPAPEQDPLGFKAPYWVYHSFHHGQPTKVHAAQCHHCRDGQGRKDGKGRYGDWTPFQTLEAATLSAHTIDPNEEVQCSMCIRGRYRKRAGLKDVQNGNPRRSSQRNREQPQPK